MFEIDIYVSPDGQCPFQSWIDSLDPKTRRRIQARLDRVRAGNLGDRHSMGDGVSELRLMFGAGYRVYYGMVNNRLVLLLVGGSKKRQNRDIAVAKACWQEYKQR